MDFERLYSEFYPQVFAYLLKLTGDHQLAEELTQDTFFKIFRKIDDYRGDCSFNVFACRIAKNNYYSYLKKRRKQAPPPSAEIPDEGPSIEDRLDDKQLASKIHAVLHTLPEPYREVFWMRVFGELPFEEIARLHGRTESWARVTFHRAKLKIQEEL